MVVWDFYPLKPPRPPWMFNNLHLNISIIKAYWFKPSDTYLLIFDVDSSCQGSSKSTSTKPGPPLVSRKNSEIMFEHCRMYVHRWKFTFKVSCLNSSTIYNDASKIFYLKAKLSGHFHPVWQPRVNHRPQTWFSILLTYSQKFYLWL